MNFPPLLKYLHEFCPAIKSELLHILMIMLLIGSLALSANCRNCIWTKETFPTVIQSTSSITFPYNPNSCYSTKSMTEYL